MGLTPDDREEHTHRELMELLGEIRGLIDGLDSQLEARTKDRRRGERRLNHPKVDTANGAHDGRS